MSKLNISLLYLLEFSWNSEYDCVTRRVSWSFKKSSLRKLGHDNHISALKKYLHRLLELKKRNLGLEIPGHWYHWNQMVPLTKLSPVSFLFIH